MHFINYINQSINILYARIPSVLNYFTKMCETLKVIEYQSEFFTVLSIEYEKNLRF